MAKKSGIGSIQIDIDAMITKFDTNMAKADKRLDKIEKNSRKAAAASKKAAEAAEKGWLKAGKAIRWMGAGIIAVGAAFASVKVARSLDAAADKVVDLGKKSKTLGIPVEKLSELRFAAEESNVEFSNLILMLSTASRNFGEFANTGGGPAVQTIKDLNLELFDAEGNLRGIVDLLPDISRKLTGLNKSQQLGFAGKIFGEEQGGRFVQMLEDSDNFIDTLDIQAERARRLGVVFSAEQVQNLTKYTDAVNRVGEAWFGIKVKIIDAVAPELEEFLDDIAGLMAATPSIVGAIAEAFRTDDPEIEQRLDELGDAIIAAMAETGRSAGMVLVAGIQDAIVIGMDIIMPTFLDIGRNIAASILEGYAAAFREINDGSWGGRMAGLLTGMTTMLDVAAFEQRGKALPDRDEFMQQFNAAMTDPTMLTTPLALEASGKAMAEAYGQAFVQAESLFGVLDKIRKHSMDIDLFGKGGKGGGLQHGPFLPGEEPPDQRKSKWDEYFDGINTGFDGLIEKAEDFEALGQASITSFANTISGDLARALSSGELQLKDFGKTAVSVFTKAAESVLNLVLQFFFARAVVGGLNMIPGIGPESSPTPSSFTGPVQPRRHGGAFLDGMPLDRFAAGGIVSRPTLFPMRRGMGLMGEAGPEAIMPLTRVGGDLGVKTVGGGVVVNVIDQRGSGEPVGVEESRGPDGRRVISLLIRDEVRKLVGNGSLDRTMGAAFGVRRQGTPR